MTYRFCPACGTALAARRFKDFEPDRLACSRCDFVHYDAPAVAVGGIFTMDGGVVLLRRGIEPGYGAWVFPGGYVDRGESAEEAVVRETLEEVGVSVRVERLLNVYSYRRRGLIIIVFRTVYVGGDLHALDESLEVRTFPRADIPWGELAFPSTRHALGDYLLSTA
jgi:ADP-ribose pyrophosphatase YjhB (NUDIX family)